ncbi:MAG: ABC-2 family transporter protein [Opitutaceae bacterium]
MSFRQYLNIWLACLRYSLVRTMMFRFDFFLWAAVELAWMGVNVLLVEVIYRHTASVAGWGKYEMLLLVGTSMLIQRLLMGFFWSNLFEMGRNVRTGYFDFYLAQPGNPLFMISTRKLDPDSLINTFVAASVIFYAAHRLGLHPGITGVLLYLLLVACGVVIHYSLFLLTTSTTFWIIKTEGIEGSYFSVVDFSRLPREAFRGFANVLLVYLLPAVVVSNVPANALIHGFQPGYAVWLLAVSAAWLALAVFVFNRGLKRYASASS